MTLLLAIAGGLVVTYLPGATIFRLPLGDRLRRSSLAAEERVYWHVLISLAWSLAVVLVMAAAGVYSFPRLLIVNGGLAVGALAVARQRLLYNGAATRVTIAAIVPLLLIGLGIWRFFPAAEYVIGGKDPGVYVNDGIAIDRTGRLFRKDEVIAKVPEASRQILFPKHDSGPNNPPPLYYGLRFMGVYITDPVDGSVISHWPHLYPASIAIGYHLAGAKGAASLVSVWAILGLLSVYFFGSRLIGRLPAFFGTVLLALNVIEVWFGRYPTTEVVMQTLVFGAMLALGRDRDGDGFFGWIAGVLCGLLIFLRFDAFLAIATIGAALALLWVVQKKRIPLGFVVPVLAGTAIGFAYYGGPMRQGYQVYELNLPSLAMSIGLLIAVLAAVVILGSWRARFAAFVTEWLPLAMAGVVVAMAVYALFLRHPVGKLAEYDAYSLRAFRDVYVYWPALIAAIAGFVMVARREFWREPVFFIVLAGFGWFFFYKIRVWPEQLWMSRRFLPVILPGMLLLASAAVFGSSTPEFRRTVRRGVAAVIVIGFVGWQYFVAARPIARHHEYRGAIRQVDRLAAHFTNRDLVVFEGRGSSDVHTLALPLAYEFDRQVLVLESSPLPDRRQFAAFLNDALRKYERVFFVASGGTDFLSAGIEAHPVAFEPLTVPEFETTAWNEFPKAARTKDLGYSIYRLEPADRSHAIGFSVDVGYFDDANVVRFFAREVSEGRSFRWTMGQSFVAVTGLKGDEREVEFVMHDGGRPAAAPPAIVDVFFNDTPLGRISVGFGFQSYRLAIPTALIHAAAQSDYPAQLRLVSSVWSPRDFGGGSDTRELGVMMDRVEIH